MTKTQFNSLKGGDLVLFPSGRIRSITKGPADDKGSGIKVPRYGKSQYHTLTAVKFFGDVPKRLIKLSKRCRGPALRAELVRLKELGFDLRSDVVKDAQRALDADRRMGRPPCKLALRLLAKLSVVIVIASLLSGCDDNAAKLAQSQQQVAILEQQSDQLRGQITQLVAANEKLAYGSYDYAQEQTIYFIGHHRELLFADPPLTVGEIQAKFAERTGVTNYTTLRQWMGYGPDTQYAILAQ